MLIYVNLTKNKRLFSSDLDNDINTYEHYDAQFWEMNIQECVFVVFEYTCLDPYSEVQLFFFLWLSPLTALIPMTLARIVLCWVYDGYRWVKHVTGHHFSG